MVNFLFSFLLPFLVVIAGLALRGAMPFGNGSLLAIDAWGQYYPMLCAMKEAIKSGELFWSGKGLMGFNLWAQNAYYTIVAAAISASGQADDCRYKYISCNQNRACRAHLFNISVRMYR